MFCYLLIVIMPLSVIVYISKNRTGNQKSENSIIYPNIFVYLLIKMPFHMVHLWLGVDDGSLSDQKDSLFYI